MARWRQAVELAMTDEEIGKLAAPAQRSVRRSDDGWKSLVLCSGLGAFPFLRRAACDEPATICNWSGRLNLTESSHALLCKTSHS